MGMRGRPLSYEPFRVKIDGAEIGSYRVNLGKGKGIVNLKTQDYAEAVTRIRELVSNGATQMGSVGAPSNSNQGVQNVSIPQTSSNTAVHSSTPTEKIPSAKEILSAWIHDSATSVSGTAVSSQSESTTDSVSANATTKPLAPVIPIRPKQTGLTPEQAEKLGRGLKKVLTKINVIGGETLVRLMGKDPCALEDDELELVALGWELMLEEYFIKTKPKAWMVLAAGNAMMLLAMYLRGTPIQKVETEETVTIQ